ncbi:porin family protein [Cesiribacter sp. SM1]|uniref:porin family protein n=1 Tax=Cesiribacter sp. SM1 TaxID=2861196 RepID=UPI001CD1FDBB|nr:porin family protein [Cesiribacter sp. SM1]
MRKIFFTLTLLALFAGGALAQARVGLKAGVNLATIDGKNVDDSEFILGYAVGGMLNAPIAPGVSLQPELLFTLKGTGDTGTEDNLTLMYLELPVMAKVMLGDAFSLQFGPYVGVLINSKKGNDTWEDILNNFDGGVGLGLGYSFAQRITLDLRYMYGLTQVYEDELPASVNVPEAIRDDEGGNRVLQLSVGYLLGGGR